MTQLFQHESLRKFLEIPEKNQDIGPSADQIDFMDRLVQLNVPAGEKVIAEGDQGSSLFILDRGSARVVKESDGGKIIGELKEGDFFGELSLFTDQPRAASVVAHTDVAVFRLDKQDFQDLIHKYPHMSGSFLKKLYVRLTESYQNLEQKHDELQKSNQTRKELASVFIGVVMVTSMYTFALGLFDSGLFAQVPHWIHFGLNRLLEVVALYVIIRIVMNSTMPLEGFGLTLKKWKPALVQSLWITSVAIMVLTAIKYLAVINEWSFLPHDRVVDWSYFDWTYVTYLVVVPLQEFIARGVLQSSIQRLLIGRFAAFWAVMITSFLFGALHLHASVNLGIAALVTGWLWGWMYAKYPTLLGVSVCHFVIGNWAGLLGFWTIL